VSTPADKTSPYPQINSLECKGCSRCIEACPKQVLQLGSELNSRGYRFVQYSGAGCIGCANCFYACPEPHTFEIHKPERR
jgi:NAD-dependent dihydropyrimidine dehydrogenase PreA subunit